MLKLMITISTQIGGATLSECAHTRMERGALQIRLARVAHVSRGVLLGRLAVALLTLPDTTSNVQELRCGGHVIYGPSVGSSDMVGPRLMPLSQAMDVYGGTISLVWALHGPVADDPAHRYVLPMSADGPNVEDLQACTLHKGYSSAPSAANASDAGPVHVPALLHSLVRDEACRRYMPPLAMPQRLAAALRKSRPSTRDGATKPLVPRALKGRGWQQVHLAGEQQTPADSASFLQLTTADATTDAASVRACITSGADLSHGIRSHMKSKFIIGVISAIALPLIKLVLMPLIMLVVRRSPLLICPCKSCAAH